MCPSLSLQSRLEERAGIGKVKGDKHGDRKGQHGTEFTVRERQGIRWI